MEKKTLNPLVALGLGVGAGVLSLWMLLELWPILILGGATYLIYKGLDTPQVTQKETKHEAMD